LGKQLQHRSHKLENASAWVCRARSISRIALISLPLTLIAAGAVFAAPAATASSHVFPTMNDSGGIYWRSGTNWNTPILKSGYGFYPGTRISVSCCQMGTANVPGSADAMWVKASWASGPGTGSGWINEHFVNDGAPINKAAPGVPACPSGGTTAASKAIAWARQYLGKNYDSGACLPFIYQAYQAASINIGNASTAARYWSTNPRGYTRHPGNKNPAVGSLLFWGATTANSAGHVGIYEGNNTVISTWSWPEGGSAGPVHQWSFSGRNAAGYPYLGWMLP
jgi:cell wall-associated NlpC family hydrolase